MPVTIMEHVIHEAMMVCRKRITVEGLKTAAPKLLRTIFPVWAKTFASYPAGVCIHEFATTIQKPDKCPPIKTSKADSQYTPFDTLFLPNTNTPIKTDSRKNATTPSIARMGPKMSPTILEYDDQLLPNENSMVIPVATPTTKITPKSLARKSVIFL